MIRESPYRMQLLQAIVGLKELLWFYYRIGFETLVVGNPDEVAPAANS